MACYVLQVVKEYENEVVEKLGKIGNKPRKSGLLWYSWSVKSEAPFSEEADQLLTKLKEENKVNDWVRDDTPVFQF